MLLMNHQFSIVSFDNKITRDRFSSNVRRLNRHDTYTHGAHIEGHKQVLNCRSLRKARRQRQSYDGAIEALRSSLKRETPEERVDRYLSDSI